MSLLLPMLEMHLLVEVVGNSSEMVMLDGSASTDTDDQDYLALSGVMSSK